MPARPEEADHVTAIDGDWVALNCDVNFPDGHVVPYVVQWWRKVSILYKAILRYKHKYYYNINDFLMLHVIQSYVCYFRIRTCQFTFGMMITHPILQKNIEVELNGSILQTGNMAWLASN